MELHQTGVERRRLAGPGGPGDQENARRALEQLFETGGDDLRQAEVENRARRPCLIQDADHDALARVARDHRDPQVNRDLAAAAVDRHLEAPVLRPPPLRDVELGEDPDAGRDLAHVAIEVLLRLAEVRLMQDAINPVAYVQAGRQHFQMNVTTAALERAEQDLAKEAVRP